MSNAMDPQAYQQLKPLFETAVKLCGAERQNYLDEACSGDTELRNELEALLAHDQAADGFLDRPAVDVPPDADAEQRIPMPERIGQYRLLGVLGVGGMGVVYRAEQERPSRVVALKVIKPGLATGRALRRFEFEADVLGRLQHPGIAQIYEAGAAETEGGRQPFFAMELVEGEPLVAYAASRSLGTRDRLGLLLKVGDALQHAHSSGVIHRDLKPGNIIVDRFRQPKILDFGVARLTDAEATLTTQQTAIGQLIGTVSYMSPEQVIGDPDAVDTLSDVYALGIVGYELLTGQLPHNTRGKTITEAIRTISEDDPTPLSAVNPVFRGELAIVFEKALQRDKTRRYQTVAAFLGDVSRFLNDEPITARAPSSAYRFRKLIRRHRALAGGVLATCLALVLGLAGTTIGMIRANTAAAREHVARQQAAAEARKARLEAQQTRTVLSFLTKMLGAPDPGKDGKSVRVADVLDRATETVSEQMAEEPELEAVVRHTIGTTYIGLGLYAEAAEQLEAAVRIRRACHGLHDANTLDSVNMLALALSESGRFSDAERSVREALGAYQPSDPADPRLVTARDRLAHAVSRQGRDAEAEELWRGNLLALEEAGQDDHPLRAESLNNLGQMINRHGRHEEAQQLLSEAVELSTRLKGAQYPETLGMMNNLATNLQAQGKFGDAEALQRRILAIRRETVGHRHPTTIHTMNNLSRCLAEQERFVEAESLAREVLDAYTASLGPKHSYTLAGQLNLAVLLVDSGRPEEAQPLFEDLLQTAEEALPQNHWLKHVFRAKYGAQKTALGDYEQAETLLLPSYEALKAQLGDEHRQTQKAQASILTLYEAWDKPDRAAEYATTTGPATPD